MVNLDALYHLPYDGVIIGILDFSPLVDDVLDLLQPCLEVTILTLALPNRRDAFGELVDLCGYALEIILIVFRIIPLLNTQGYLPVSLRYLYPPSKSQSAVCVSTIPVGRTFHPVPQSGRHSHLLASFWR